MHCLSCNNPLTDFEATKKTTDGEYLDLCNACHGTINDDIDVDVRYDLMTERDTVLLQEEDAAPYKDFRLSAYIDYIDDAED